MSSIDQSQKAADQPGGGSDAEARHRVLVVAYRTAATPKLVEAVRERARRGPCKVTLLVPAPYSNPYTEEAEKIIELAVPLLEDAARAPVDAVVGDTDPAAAVRRAVDAGSFDEVIVSTLPQRISRWLKLDLPAHVERLGLPMTTIVATARVIDRQA